MNDFKTTLATVLVRELNTIAPKDIVTLGQAGYSRRVLTADPRSAGPAPVVALMTEPS